MSIIAFLGKFLAVVGGVWMLALAYKIVGDTWDALFSKKYKKWLAHFTQKGKTEITKTGKKINKIIVAKHKEHRESIIFPIRKDRTKSKKPKK
jgi:hypothetical protein